MLSTASRVTENRQIRKSTKEILRSEFRSKNKIGQEKFIFILTESFITLRSLCQELAHLGLLYG